MVTQNFSDEELEGVRSMRQMIEERIAWDNLVQGLLRQKRRVQQAQQEVQ